MVIEDHERVRSFNSIDTPSTLTNPVPQNYTHEGGARELIGGSGVSLDGRSLILPADGGEGDDISSINTDYNSRRMRALGQVDPAASPSWSSPHKGYSDENYNKYAYPSKLFSLSKSKEIPPSQDDVEDDDGCCPIWITEAPFWLKMVIVVSTALLLGSIVLVGVGASLAVQNRADKLAAAAPTSVPIISWPTSDGFGNAGEDIAPITSDTREPAVVPTPSLSPVADLKEPWEPKNTTINFFVLGGRFMGEALTDLPAQLENMPELYGDSVLFHLGDWNSPFTTSCIEQSFEDNVDLFSQSNLPVYFIVGDNEFNDCPNPNQAYNFWQEYFVDFESQHWSEPALWDISRQDKYPENFAYIYKRVLVLGINLVGGVVHDNKEWEQRHNADLDWIDYNYYEHNGQFDTLVILAHADPEIQANEKFFETFYEVVEFDYTETQVIFIHRNLGIDTWGLEPSYNRIDNLFMVVVEGSIWPPMLVSIDTAAGLVEIDQEQWYQDYVASDN